MGLDITLNPPNICLITAESDRGIVPDNKDYRFGSVYKINVYTYNCKIGDKILFNKTESVLITQQEGSIPPSYFIIDEAEFKFIENPIP